MVDTDVHEMSKFEGRGVNIAHWVKSTLVDFLDRANTHFPRTRRTNKEWKQIATWERSLANEKSYIGDAPANAVDAYALERAFPR